MAFVEFFANLITAQVNQSGSAAQIQDSPLAPDNDWLLVVDHGSGGSFTLNFDPAEFPETDLAPNSQARLALYVRNSKDTGREAQWGGTLYVNGGSQAYNRVTVTSPTGVYQEDILSVTGGVPLTSLLLDLDWTPSGGSAADKVGVDFDAISLTFEFADLFDLAGNAIGVGKGQGTMDILPVELGTATGAGAGAGSATMTLVPPTELAASGDGLGTGTSTLDLVPPTELAGNGLGLGAGTGDMDQLPYDMSASGVGVGRGTGILEGVDNPIVLQLNITDPLDGGTVFELYRIKAVELDPDIPLVRVAIKPVDEGLKYGYEATPDLIDGEWYYDWSTSPYVGQNVPINAWAVFLGLSTGVGPTGFQITGGYGRNVPAQENPVNVDVIAGGFIELQGSGAGAGDGSATMDLIPATELAASGTGLGIGTGGTLSFVLGPASGIGVGAGSGTFDVFRELVASDVYGVGTGTGTVDVFYDLEASGTGIGTGTGVWEGIIDMVAQGHGEGLGDGAMDAFYDMSGAGTGTGRGISVMSMDDQPLWQDPVEDVSPGQPWDVNRWVPLAQVAPATGTAVVVDVGGNFRNELQVDSSGGGGVYHRGLHGPLHDSVLLFDVRNVTGQDQQIMCLSASGHGAATLGLPTDALLLFIQDGTFQPNKIIGGVITALNAPVPYPVGVEPFHCRMELIGSDWFVYVWADDAGFAKATVLSGTDADLGLMAAGQTIVHAQGDHPAATDKTYDEFYLWAHVNYWKELSGSGTGVGTGSGTLSLVGDDIIDLAARGFGYGTGEGTMVSSPDMQAAGTGLGTGTGTMTLITVDMPDAAGTGTGNGSATMVQSPYDMVGSGLGRGIGRGVWNTGNWPGGSALVPGGTSDSKVIPPHGEAEVKDSGTDSDMSAIADKAAVEGGAATVEVASGSGSTGD